MLNAHAKIAMVLRIKSSTVRAFYVGTAGSRCETKPANGG